MWVLGLCWLGARAGTLRRATVEDPSPSHAPYSLVCVPIPPFPLGPCILALALAPLAGGLRCAGGVRCLCAQDAMGDFASKRERRLALSRSLARAVRSLARSLALGRLSLAQCVRSLADFLAKRSQPLVFSCTKKFGEGLVFSFLAIFPLQGQVVNV